MGADDQQKADYAFTRWRVQGDHYAGYARFWTRVILFLVGKQWLTWKRDIRLYVPERNVPKWRQQPVTNLMFAVYRTAVAKLTKQRPAFDCVPVSQDSDDIEAAELGNALLDYWWRFLEMAKLLKRALGDLLTTGNMHVLVHWDTEAGPVSPLMVPVAHPTTGEDVDTPADEDGEPIMRDMTDLEKKAHDNARAEGSVEQGDDYPQVPDTDASPKTVAQGEIKHTLINPMCIRYNPEAESPEDAEEVYIGTIESAAIASKKYDIPEGEIQGGGDTDLMSYQDVITAASTGLTSQFGIWNGSDNATAKGKRTLVLRYYRKPCSDYPEGRHWIQVGKTIVEKEQPLPYGFWPPHVTAQDVTVPGQPVAMGLLGQIMPLNEEYNTLNGKIMEHNVTMGFGGKWAVSPEDAKLKIDSDPAQILISKGYAAGRPPMQIPPMALPGEVYQERERIMGDLQLVSNLNELSLGKKPEGVSSGRGFLTLQEQTDSTLSPTLMAVEDFLQEVGRRDLVLAQKYYREERTIKIKGENGVWQFRSFKGSDLSDSMDVQVQVGSSFPWSRAARQDIVMSTLQAFPGLVTNAQTGVVDQQKLGKYLEVGGLPAFTSENDPDEVEIDKEHAQFEAIGENQDPNIPSNERGIPQIGFWQDHAAHFAGHCAFMKRDRGRFDKWSPEAQAAFLQHIQQTLDAVHEGVASMMPQMPPNPAQAGPNGPGQAPPTPEATAAPGISTGSNSPGAQLTPADFHSAQAA